MNAKRTIYGDVISNIMAFSMMICPVSLLAYLQTRDTGTAWLCLLLLPVFLLLYVFRKKIKSFWLFILSHAAVLVVPFIVFRGNGILRLLFCAFAAVCVVYSFYSKYRGEPAAGQFFLYGSIFCIGKTLIASYYGFDELIGLSVLLELILAAGYIAIQNMRKLDASLAVFSARVNMDNRRVLRFNNFLLMGFISATVSIAAAAFFFVRGNGIRVINEALGLLADFLKRLVSFLFGWLFSFMIPQDDVPKDIEPEPFMNLEGTASESSQNFGDIFLKIAVFIIIVVAVILVYKLFTRLYKNFKRNNDDGDVEEELERRTVKERVFRIASSGSFGTGSVGKIRRRYYKAVKRQKDINLKNTDTTGDILQKSADNITSLTQEYERARYG